VSRAGESLQGQRPFPWVEGGLLLLAVALGGVLWWEWQAGQNLESSMARWRKIPATAVPPLAIAPEFRLPDAASGFPELLARPIFQSSRRMAVDPSANAPSAMKRGQFVLVGVLISPATSAALLRDAETGKTETVVLGAQIRGLTLAEVGAERAVLRLGAEFEDLRLALQRGSSGRPAPAASATVGTATGGVAAGRTATAASGAAGPAAPATAAASATQPVIEGTIPPTFPVPPTPPNPYQNSKPVGLGAGAGAGAGVGPRPGGAR
jgi:hypothetical protein